MRHPARQQPHGFHFLHLPQLFLLLAQHPDARFELGVSLLQGAVPGFDHRQHAVEAVDQQVQLVVAVKGRGLIALSGRTWFRNATAPEAARVVTRSGDLVHEGHKPFERPKAGLHRHPGQQCSQDHRQHGLRRQCLHQPPVGLFQCPGQGAQQEQGDFLTRVILAQLHGGHQVFLATQDGGPPLRRVPRGQRGVQSAICFAAQRFRQR